MTIVTAQMSVSVDGCYAGPQHADMQTWLEGPEAAGFFRVTRWAIDAEACLSSITEDETRNPPWPRQRASAAAGPNTTAPH
jgi:hypothetical protein